VNNGHDWIGANLTEVPPLVDVLVDLADDGNVIAAKDVKTENNLKANIKFKF
jgi:hypothetical protein